MTGVSVDSGAENPFEVLGVDRDSDTEEIRLAYRSAARRHHPDHGGDAKEFSRITDAYRTLRDSDQRATVRDGWTNAAAPEVDPIKPDDSRSQRRYMGPVTVGLIASASALFVLSLGVTWAVAGPLLFGVVLIASSAVGGIAATIRHLMNDQLA